MTNDVTILLYTFTIAVYENTEIFDVGMTTDGTCSLFSYCCYCYSTFDFSVTFAATESLKNPPSQEFATSESVIESLADSEGTAA